MRAQPERHQHLITVLPKNKCNFINIGGVCPTGFTLSGQLNASCGKYYKGKCMTSMFLAPIVDE